MLEVSDRPRAREHITRLGQLEGYLLGRREVEAPPKDDRPGSVQRGREGVQLGLSLQGAGHARGHAVEGFTKDVVAIDRLRDESQGKQAGGVGLRGRHAALRPRVQGQQELRDRCELRVGFVGDRDGHCCS